MNLNHFSFSKVVTNNTHSENSSEVEIFFPPACAVLSCLCTSLSLKIAKERPSFPTASS